jgi:hypothetical protein
VKIETDSDSAHRRRILDDSVIPEVKELSGFQKATWMNDGVGVGLLDSLGGSSVKVALGRTLGVR